MYMIMSILVGSMMLFVLRLTVMSERRILELSLSFCLVHFIMRIMIHMALFYTSALDSFIKSVLAGAVCYGVILVHRSFREQWGYLAYVIGGLLIMVLSF